MLVLGLLLPSAGWCAHLPLVPTMLQAGAVVSSDDYRLDAGDEIGVDDATMGSLAQSGVQIGSDGTVDLPLLGTVSLAGLTVGQAQFLLNRRYQPYFIMPDITIQVLSQHPTRVYIQGAVRHPGVYISGKNTHPDQAGQSALGDQDTNETGEAFYLTDALIQAGGLSAQADYTDIQIQRAGSQADVVHVNLWELFQRGNAAQDIPLQEHDVIMVPSLPNAAEIRPDWPSMIRSNVGAGLFNVSVIGSVKQPGSYPVSAKDTVLAAVAQAGGFNATANQRAVYVLRANAAGQVFKKRVNASDPRLMGKGKPDWLTLLPGDVIFVDNAPVRQAVVVGGTLIDRVTGAALLPMFSAILRKD